MGASKMKDLTAEEFRLMKSPTGRNWLVELSEVPELERAGYKLLQISPREAYALASQLGLDEQSRREDERMVQELLKSEPDPFAQFGGRINRRAA
jgi:hypothetical protein